MEKRNILIVDDDPGFCRVTETVLGAEGYRVVAETDSRRALGLLRAGEFDAVLVDVRMPGLSGLELIDRIREHDNVLPIVVVTAYGSAEVTVDAMRRGATDFMAKPVDGSLLDLRIRRAIDLEHTRRLANTDGLTGLYNHRYLQVQLADEIRRAERYGRPLSLVMADLDNFKAYNDACGHPRGDRALIEVARTLRRISRMSDVVARYGGDEFTLILPETPLAEAGKVAERARKWIAALELGGPSRLTISAGLASYFAGCTREALIVAADAALYRAKHDGRNRVAIAQRPATIQLEAAGAARRRKLATRPAA